MNAPFNLEPNLADINAHLGALFSPEFVAGHPDTWIEIATSNPASGKGAINAGKGFSVFELAQAADYAASANRKGLNVYVGMALRKGEAGSSGRANKENVVTASHSWDDFDANGDEARVNELLKQKDLKPSMVVITGETPHRRFQTFFALSGNPTPEQLEAINKALRDYLGGDAVANCDRVMRLGGTVSYPPPQKVERGYVPELTRLIINKDGSRPFEPELFLRLLKKDDKPRPPGGGGAILPFSLPAGTLFGPPRPDGPQASGASNDESTFWRKVNELALANLDVWVPEIFGDDAVFQKGTGAYRISSKALNRNLEEDLSISPKGITDWGLDDQGKPGEKAARYTAIDIVILHGGAANPAQAALWLCEKMAIEPGELGWESGSGNPEIDRLAQLSREEYEKARKKAAKDMGMRVSVLDEMVEQARAQARDGGAKGEAAAVIERINADHALVLAGNKAAVMKFDDPTTFRLLQPGSFSLWFGDQFIQSGDELVPLGRFWMMHPDKRKFAGIEFAPPGTPSHPGFYNLWQGFAVGPVAGDCSKFLAHVKDNVARGDEETYNWIIGWWAQIFQQPSIKMGTSLVLRGPFGTGKTKVGQVFGSLLDPHYQLVASPRYVTGQFNSHMASLLVLHADEAFWAGDKAAVGSLRDLVTNDGQMLEYKGIDPIKIRNHIRLFVSGNPDWMVPAGFKERRWAIFDMGEDKMQDSAYFAAIDEEMNNGGREALLHYLLNFDLKEKGVDLRKIPRTAALFDQQLESMDAEQAWWFEMLMRGALPSKPPSVSEDRVVLKDALYEVYILHAKMRGVVRRSMATKVGMFLSKYVGPALQQTRPVSTNPPKTLNCYRVPPLKECRERFAAQVGQPIDWGTDWETTVWEQNDDMRDMLERLLAGRKISALF